MVRHVLHLASNQANRFPQGRDRSDDVIFDISSGDLTAAADQQILMYVESACVPVAGYPVNDLNNQINLSSDVGDRVVVIPVGVYANGPVLVAAMNTVLTTTGTTGVAFNWVPLTYRISCTRTSTTAWYINAYYSSAKTIIGSGYTDLVLPINVPVTFPGVIDLSGPKKILITSPDIEVRTRDSVGRNINVLAAMPVDQLWGGLVTYQNQTGGLLTTNRKLLSELRLVLLDEDQLPIDLNGLEWAVSIVIEIF